ncbi:MAG: Unknown protein [uncultured Sulfurovum sp.]|uniref:Uncharacterized protein n=1 Tax=uncultured Sulfurovum sp. TaxID=269237 RepID=A0A6S6SLA8_9BACT|nr:MAG: Unknown protein [uncultured Sulfurovum sp.]
MLVLLSKKERNLFTISFCENYESLLFDQPYFIFLVGYLLYEGFQMRLIFLTLLTLTLLNGRGVLDVEWSSANKAQQKPTVPYPKVLVEGIKSVTLPVYLSSSYAYNKKMTVVADKYFYSISFDLEGAMVLFEGDRTFQESVSPQNPEFKKIMQKTLAVEFSKSEEIMMAEYQRHGANYTISVECDKPDTDKRCLKEDFIRSLYNSLNMVGGHP